MKRPSFLNKHRTKNGYELNTSTSSSYSNNNNTNDNSKEKEVVLSSIAVLCNESKSHTKKHNNRSSLSHHANGGRREGAAVDIEFSTNADDVVLNSTTILNNISLEDSYSTSEEGGKVLPSSVAVFVDDLILCGNEEVVNLTIPPQELLVDEESPTGVADFNVSFGSADFDYFVDNRFSANDDDEQESDELKAEKKGEYGDEKTERKTGESSMNNEKTDNVRYTMVEDNKTIGKGGKKMKKGGNNNNNKSSIAEFSNTFNDDTFSISLASTANNSNDTSSYTQQDFLHRTGIDNGVSSASQQYINEHIQILLDTILLPTSVLLPKSVKDEVSHTILPAFKSTANDVTDNIELILTLPADYIANALTSSETYDADDEMKKKVVKSNDMSSSVSSFMNSVNAGYESVSKSKSAKGNVSSSILNESNISNETIKTSNLLLCGSGSGTSCIERDFLYNTCVDQ